METLLTPPTARDQQLARACLPHFARLHPAGAAIGEALVTIQLPEQTAAVALPGQALELLEFILTKLAAGQAVSLGPVAAELSTQQAADQLGVSRPHLVKLLEQGHIPFRKVGRHRRVQPQDLRRYEQQVAEARQPHLQFLAEQAQELHLGYE